MKLDSIDIPNYGFDFDTRAEASKARQSFEAIHREQIDWDNFLEQLEQMEHLKEQIESLTTRLEAMIREFF